MAYEKQTWECGEVISAEKLNHIEDGIEEASQGGSVEPMIVRAIDDQSISTITLDKTFGEIKTAFLSGVSVIIDISDDDHPIDYRNISVVECTRSGDAFLGAVCIDDAYASTGYFRPASFSVYSIALEGLDDEYPNYNYSD